MSTQTKPADALSVPSERICTKCHITYPANHFKFRGVTDKRLSSWCRRCNAIDQRIRYAKKKSKQQEKILHHTWSELSRGCQRHEAQRFISNLIAQFGGPKMLANAWLEAFTQATAVKKLRAAESLIFLLERFAANPDSHDFRKLENLEAEESRLAESIIAEQMVRRPGSVAIIASRYGFTLTPKTTVTTTQP